MRKRPHAGPIAALFVICAVTACGGGGGGGGPTPGPAPAPTPSPTPPSTVSPTISQQPSPVTLIAGRAATFSVVVAGTPAPTIQWQRSSGPGVAFADIAGATAATYTLSGAAAGDSGASFRALITNSIGSVTSQPATLTVMTATQAANVIRMGFNASNLLGLGFTAVDAIDDTNKIQSSSALCSLGGSVASTINGAPTLAGASIPLPTGTLVASFNNCRKPGEVTYDGQNTLGYYFALADRLNGSFTSTMSNMRVRFGGDSSFDQVGDGTVQWVTTSTTAASVTTEVTNFTPQVGTTLLDSIVGVTATMGTGSILIRFAYTSQQFQEWFYKFNSLSYSVGGATYVANGELLTRFNAMGFATSSTGEITVNAGSSPIGKVTFNVNRNGYVIDLGEGQVVPVSAGPRVVTYARSRALF